MEDKFINIDVLIHAPYINGVFIENEILKVEFPLNNGLKYNKLGDIMITSIKDVTKKIMEFLNITQNNITQQKVNININYTGSLKTYYQYTTDRYYDGITIQYYDEKLYNSWVRRKKIKNLLDGK